MTVFVIGIIIICVKVVQTFKLLRIRLRIAVCRNEYLLVGWYCGLLPLLRSGICGINAHLSNKLQVNMCGTG